MLVLLHFSVTESLFAETNDIVSHDEKTNLTGFKSNSIFFEFKTGFGVCSSITNELIFENDKTISKLNWIQYASPLCMVNGRLVFYNFFCEFLTSFCVPFRCGVLHDYDYLEKSSTKATQYSKHDIYLDKFFDLSSRFGYEFHINSWFIAPIVDVKYSMRKWEAHDGFLQYPTSGFWVGDEPKNYVMGNIISYEQSILLPELSLIVRKILPNDFSIFSSFTVCPYCVVDTLDSHFMRSKQFFDTMRGGFSIKADFGFSYKRFDFSFSHRYLKVLNGTTKSTPIGFEKPITKELSTSGVIGHEFQFGVSYIF